MIRWVRDLVSLFKRPINGDGKLPNYGNIPDKVLYDHQFEDSEAQMEIKRRIDRRE